jgi:hypothetical protein
MSPITFATEPWDESRGNPKDEANSIENTIEKRGFEPEVRILEILRPGGKTLGSFAQMYAINTFCLFSRINDKDLSKPRSTRRKFPHKNSKIWQEHRTRDIL